MPVSAPVSTERTTTQVDVQQRSHGEFIMSGNLTRLDNPVREPDTQPVDLSAVMPDFTQREEVYVMIKKLRESVFFWKRIQESSVDNAWENAQSFALPQHHLFIK
ncbi:hypothetical protein ASH00_04925 [Arthrobacter sp. Soil782]|uniref:hypothetical protein n=1 Tax=Arthrobacter sp. Soil782 TaxID=1736410 RepID=UPI0006FDA155|nr:hypothetical protein [Arthrobacter sp. Soil782]KRF09016.1 hypothetical protein ASH00_04925 [Arthrobacter sp. Soil782]